MELLLLNGYRLIYGGLLKPFSCVSIYSNLNMLTWASSLMAKSRTRSKILSGKIKNERSKICFCWYFGLFPETNENGLWKKTEISVETNFRSFIFFTNQNVASGYTLCLKAI